MFLSTLNKIFKYPDNLKKYFVLIQLKIKDVQYDIHKTKIETKGKSMCCLLEVGVAVCSGNTFHVSQVWCSNGVCLYLFVFSRPTIITFTVV